MPSVVLSFLPLAYLAVVSVPLIVTDIRSHRLPNALIVPGYVVLLISLGGVWISTGFFPWLALVGAVGYFVFLYLLAWLGGMGMGDVKLAGVLGGASGLLSLEAVILSPVISFLTAGLFGLAVWAVTRSTKTRIPFGPFMIAGAWLAAGVTVIPG